MNFGHIKNIHFVGIGGIGMSGIAEILRAHDMGISGCDLRDSSVTAKLRQDGITVLIGHDPSHLDNVDLVVISSAVRGESPELDEAHRRHIPVIRRAEMLGEIMRLKKGIGVSGTHGKTTTSAMTAVVLAEAGLDPTLIIGGILRNFGTNARLGGGSYLVVEADEYDRSFLTLQPTWAVITNIEADHLDCYRDLDDIRATFAQFASGVPFYGTVIGCADDENVMSLLETLEKRTLSYGTGAAAQLRAVEIENTDGGSRFQVTLRGEALGTVELHVPGEHNIRNSLAALGVALEIDIPFQVAARALAGFTGVERRFQVLGEFQGALIVDDYAHHPSEIKATLDAARRSYPGRRIVALFQPHLFTRTRDFFESFAESLEGADVALVSPIYPAREKPIDGVTAELITDAANRRGAGSIQFVDLDREGLIDHVRGLLADRDLFLTMGAGDVNRVAQALVAGVEA